MVKTRQHCISCNGLNISYLTMGAGPPLLLLHGGWETGSLNWANHFEELAKHYFVISPDHRGHGKTNNPGGEFTSYGHLAWDMIGFIEALNLDQKPMVMGHSSGAVISLHMSIYQPDLLDRQVLIGIHPYIGASKSYLHGVEMFFETSDWRKPPDKWHYIFRHPMISAALWWAHRKTPWFELLRAVWPMWTKPFELEKSDYSKITCPSLVITGEEDEFGTVQEARELAKLIKNSEFKTIAHANHMFVNDRPELLQKNVLPFLGVG